MDDFIKGCLQPILNSDVDDEIVQYIKDMKVVEDFEEFIDNIIDTGNPKHAENYEQLKAKLFGITMNNAKQHLNQPAASTAPKNKNQTSKKAETEAFPILPGTKNEPQQKYNTKAQKQRPASSASNSSFKEMSKSSYITPEKKDMPNGKIEQVNSSGKGKKTKFRNIKSCDSTIGMKQGRHPCDCEAKNHPLINNCLKCGRIVCEQEGSGPCFFCDTMVCRNEEEFILESNTKQSDRLYNRLKDQKTSKEWKKAVETRDRLVKADKSGEHKRQVYDDQGDYYSTDKWKSKKYDSEVLQRLRKSTKEMKFALDLASRTIVSSKSDYEKNKEYLLKGVNKLLDTTDERFPKNVYTVTNMFCDLNIDNSNKTPEKSKKILNEEQQEKSKPSPFSSVKVANESFLAQIDRGMCLSMHQPWASLLVAGIKIHEGRTWPTEHRGRLWIHAASKEPENAEILDVEKMYRSIYNDPELVFPKQYPTSCLLGSVFVETCLEQKRYRQLYPQGESDSPYVLICHSPMILPVFYPMQGQHKIFPLTKEMHKTVKEALMSSKWL